MPKRATLAIAAAMALTAAGCGSSRLDTFPEFPGHKARLGTSRIFADFVVMKATSGDTAAVDLGENKAAADTLLRFVQAQLDAKGYQVAGRLLSSVGLLVDSSVVANVTRTSELEVEGEESGIAFHPPFYLYQAFRRDPALTGLLTRLYRRLALLGDDERGHPAMSEAVPLGRAFGGGMMFILLGGGFEVSAGAELRAAATPAAEQGAKIGYHSISQASLHLFVVDGGTGEVLWTDHQVSKGGMVYGDKFIRMAGILLEDLP